MKKFKSNTTINIDSLIRNLVIVVKDENEASETIAKKSRKHSRTLSRLRRYNSVSKVLIGIKK